jgi:hypothetical protein
MHGMQGGAVTALCSEWTFNRLPGFAIRWMRTLASAAIGAMCPSAFGSPVSAEPMSGFVGRGGTHFVLD